MRGFYKSPIPDPTGSNRPPKKQKFIAATNFEPTSARLAFPCFDEPDYKALFSISVATPKGYTVVSNEPVQEVVDMPDVPNWYIWKFVDGTVPMSTYLVAWALGKVDHVELSTTPSLQLPGSVPVPVRGYIYDGMPKDDVRFAVKVAVDSITQYETFFGIPYPKKKLDLWPMPDFSGEAMENFGLCIFHESGLFIKIEPKQQITTPLPTTLLASPFVGNRSPSPSQNTIIRNLTILSDPAAQIYVSNLVAHEVAHHWLGNLVTIGWWNNLWLNEGFANWAQYLGTAASFPEWQIHERFFEIEHLAVFETELGGYARAVGVYEESGVEGNREIAGMFDDTTYSKGASVIRMFEAWMKNSEPDPELMKNKDEPEFECSPWCRVMRNYLNVSASGTVYPDDLYNSIDTEDSSGLISAAMQGWIDKAGVPVVWVDKDGAIKQERLTAWNNSTVTPANAKLSKRNSEQVFLPAWVDREKPKKPKKPKKDEKGWFIPFGYKFLEVEVTGNKKIGTIYRDDKNSMESVSWTADVSNARIKLKNTIKVDSKNAETNQTIQRLMLANPGRTGLYRFKPSIQDMTLFAKVLQKDHTLISPIDRAGLVSDIIALTLSNNIHPNNSLPILAYLSFERHPTVWSVAVQELSRFLSVMELHVGYPALFQFVQRLVFPVADFVEWWPECTSPNSSTTAADSFEIKQLRATVLPFAANLFHEPTITKSIAIFNQWLDAATTAKQQEPTAPVPCFAIQEDAKIMIHIVYESAVKAAPFSTVPILRNASLSSLPGDFDTDRLFPIVASKLSAHLKMLLEFNDDNSQSSSPLGMGRTGAFIDRARVVIEKGGQLGVEMVWSFIRWGISARSTTAENIMFDSQHQQPLIASVATPKSEKLTPTSRQAPTTRWDALLYASEPDFDKFIERLVAEGWKDGSVWRDAVSAAKGFVPGAGFSTPRVVSARKESSLVTAVRRGLERAEAAANFRESLGAH
ncbi:hypothetical protein HK100_006634, partial [Physocladia obscura]